ASATLIPSLSFEQLTDTSELVVSGSITKSWAAWDAEHKYIWTHYQLSVTSSHKGVARGTVEFAEPGGEVAGQITMIAGAVRYRVGDQVVILLPRMPNGYLRTTGWAQGKYEVDGAGRLHSSAALASTDYTGAQQRLDGMTVAELGARVAAHVRTA